jgi:hypothetical protein
MRLSGDLTVQCTSYVCMASFRRGISINGRSHSRRCYKIGSALKTHCAPLVGTMMINWKSVLFLRVRREMLMQLMARPWPLGVMQICAISIVK